MKIEIDKMPLIEHIRNEKDGTTKVLKSINTIRINDKRRITENKITGMEGNILQDLGRELVRISFEGSVYGENAKEALEALRSKFKSGKPLEFTSDITGIAGITKVMIEDLQIIDVSGSIKKYRYYTSLREYLPPPKEEEAPASQDEEAKEDVEKKSDDSEASENYITGKVLDDEGNPRSDVDVKIKYDGGEKSIKTDNDGIYKQENLEPGKYIVIVDAPEYEGMEKEVIIKSKGEKAKVSEKESERENKQSKDLEEVVEEEDDEEL